MIRKGDVLKGSARYHQRWYKNRARILNLFNNKFLCDLAGIPHSMWRTYSADRMGLIQEVATEKWNEKVEIKVQRALDIVMLEACRERKEQTLVVDLPVQMSEVREQVDPQLHNGDTRRKSN